MVPASSGCEFSSLTEKVVALRLGIHPRGLMLTSGIRTADKKSSSCVDDADHISAECQRGTHGCSAAIADNHRPARRRHTVSALSVFQGSARHGNDFAMLSID